jgi:hypothetical protein
VDVARRVRICERGVGATRTSSRAPRQPADAIGDADADGTAAQGVAAGAVFAAASRASPDPRRFRPRRFVAGARRHRHWRGRAPHAARDDRDDGEGADDERHQDEADYQRYHSYDRDHHQYDEHDRADRHDHDDQHHRHDAYNDHDAHDLHANDHDEPVKRARPMRKLVSALAAVTLAATLSVGAATARAAGGDTTLVAVNTKDGKFLYRVRLDLRRLNGDTVDTSNAAVAVASCDACETVAVSIQALLVFGEPSTVTPENLALAMNVECSFCQTLASAYQFLLETNGPVHLTADGNHEVARIRRELEGIRREGLSIWEIQARVDGLANELAAVLATELVAAGR